MTVWLLLLSAFAVFLGAVIILSFGIVWSPVAALLCGIAARKRGMSTARYSIAGAFYSILFVAPSVYLLLRLHNIKVSGGFVRLTYTIVYTAWLFGPICYLTSLLLMSLDPLPTPLSDPLDDPSRFDTLFESIWIDFAFLVVNVFALLKSIHDLNHPRPCSNLADDEEQNSRENLLLERRYILPFVYPILLTTVFLVVIKNIPELIDKF